MSGDGLRVVWSVCVAVCGCVSGNERVCYRMYVLTLPPRLYILRFDGRRRHEERAKTRELDIRENLREDVGNVMLGRNKAKTHLTAGDLLAQPCHLDAEVSVPAGDHVVFDHGHARLVVLEDRRRCCAR